MSKRTNRSKGKIRKTSEAVRTKRVKFLLTSDTHYGLNNKTHQIHEAFLATVSDCIEYDEVAAVIHAGDWSVNTQDQFYRTMKMFRKYVDPRIPILCVRGNHDFWDWLSKSDWKYKGKKQLHWGQMQQVHKEWFKELNIHHLESGPYVVDDVIVCGFDGWYGQANPPTNDEAMMISTIEGCPSMVYHSSRAWKELERVLDEDISGYAKSICVSHFPPYGGDWKNGYNPDDLTFCANPRFLKEITSKFDVFCTGHSHERVDRVSNGCRLLNAGSDYNQPKFLLFDV